MRHFTFSRPIGIIAGNKVTKAGIARKRGLGIDSERGRRLIIIDIIGEEDVDHVR